MGHWGCKWSLRLKQFQDLNIPIMVDHWESKCSLPQNKISGSDTETEQTLNKWWHIECSMRQEIVQDIKLRPIKRLNHVALL